MLAAIISEQFFHQRCERTTVFGSGSLRGILDLGIEL